MYSPLTKGLRIRVRGQVQGVGFRPFIWQLAQRYDVKGHVLNDPEGVLILAVSDDPDAFLAAITGEAPPLSRVDGVEQSIISFDTPPHSFEIVESKGSGAETRVTPDAATCKACLADIRGDDPRRRGYAFTNCTHCGPRFSILAGLPYDRTKTTMAAFDMCDDCAAEYSDPSDRRFHAQPVACAACGPQIWFEDLSGKHDNAISIAAEKLARGAILAVKGIGGFHLCCDATNAEAIATLRERKNRPGKPLAIMGTLDHISRYAGTTDADRQSLMSAAAPIVLLDKAGDLPEGLAPGQSRLGWMLPYTPLHHLLIDAVKGPLVMTSGNISGEPQVIGNDEARQKLAHLVDGFVMHDRDIARRLDDSVLQNTPQGPMILRRARGEVPQTLALPEGFEVSPQVIAFGGHLKSAICLIKNGQALLSHHLGDLDEALTWDEFVKADNDYADLFDHTPEVFACDLHAGYRSSQHAQMRARTGTLVEVQHHHAHLAACLTENEWPLDAGPVAGIILDGLGLGPDQTIWGGELLLGDYRTFTRASHLSPAPLVGGDAAQREPWRNGLMRLDQAGLADFADELFRAHPVDVLRQAARAGLNAVPSSSAGRLFDAVAAVIGVKADRQSFEGEAAMLMEACAAGPFDDPYPFGSDLNTDVLFRAITDDLKSGCSKSSMSARFHVGLAHAFAMPARALVENGSAQAVALSGGCFQNKLLLDLTVQALRDVPVLVHNKVPANDGGLALGQAAIASAQVISNR